MTPEELARYTQLESDRDAALMAGDDDGAAVADAEMKEMDTTVAERAVGGFIKMIDPYIPIPLEVFTGLIATLAFPRVRRTAVKTIKAAVDVAKNTIKGDISKAGTAIGDLVVTAGSVVGWADSRNATEDDLATWAADARTAGDTDLAAKIDARIAAMAAGSVPA